MIAPGLVNENLSWVSTTSNLGVDLDLWNGKLGFSGDLFKRRSDGLLATRVSSVPNTFGASFPQENLNSSEIKGFDLMISHRDTKGDFRYSINALMTLSRNYRLHVEQSPIEVPGIDGSLVVTETVVFRVEVGCIRKMDNIQISLSMKKMLLYMVELMATPIVYQVCLWSLM